MGSHLKVAYRTCNIADLPNSYQLKLAQVFNHKQDDFPLRVRISTYIFTIWSRDLPIEYSRY